MLKLRLKLTRSEFGVLLTYCTDRHVSWEDTNLRRYTSLNSMILAEQYERVQRQWYTWAIRPGNKEFAYSLPISVAYALHTELQTGVQWSEAQSLLNKLNLSLINSHVQPQLVEFHD